MRFAVVDERPCLAAGNGLVDVEQASGGRFGTDLAALFERWPEFVGWAAGTVAASANGHETSAADGLLATLDPASVGSPSPWPRQVFAIGLNYHDHAAETGTPVPDSPPTFTKFPSCLTGPFSTLSLSSDSVDFEVELVVIIGRRAENVAAEHAWDYVAGLTVGQDYSDRPVQTAGPLPQFSLGKSFPGFGPVGPVLVTPDEFTDPDDLALSCTVNGQSLQSSRTSRMVFPVPELIARLSAVTPLLPGDLIFTGTPAGVGMARTPKRFLRPGDEVISTIEGIGSLRTSCVSR